MDGDDGKDGEPGPKVRPSRQCLACMIVNVGYTMIIDTAGKPKWLVYL